MLFLTTLCSTFALLSPYRVSIFLGNTQFLKEKRSDHFRADSPGLFSSRLTCSPARLRVFLCPRFSTENVAAEGPSRDGISTLCAVRLGSARLFRTEKCRRQAGARWSVGSEIFPSRSPPAPRPARAGAQLGSGATSRPRRLNDGYSFPVRSIKP